jgi:small subunit ribosomal protein S18
VAATTETERAPKRKRWDKGKYVHRRKVCAFCADSNKIIDYKDPRKLRSFISDRGKIEPRRKTGTCAKHQRVLSLAIKRARHLALLPFVPAHIYRTGGIGIQEGAT